MSFYLTQSGSDKHSSYRQCNADNQTKSLEKKGWLASEQNQQRKSKQNQKRIQNQKSKNKAGSKNSEQNREQNPEWKVGGTQKRSNQEVRQKYS